jgi:hypothetical protein
MSRQGTLVLLVDAAQKHVAIEAVGAKASELELAALARDISKRIGIELKVYVTMPTKDHARAVAKARELLRFSSAQLAA